MFLQQDRVPLLLQQVGVSLFFTTGRSTFFTTYRQDNIHATVRSRSWHPQYLFSHQVGVPFLDIFFYNRSDYLNYTQKKFGVTFFLQQVGVPFFNISEYLFFTTYRSTVFLQHIGVPFLTTYRGTFF